MVSWLECQDSSKHMETWSEVNKIAHGHLQHHFIGRSASILPHICQHLAADGLGLASHSAHHEVLLTETVGRGHGNGSKGIWRPNCSVRRWRRRVTGVLCLWRRWIFTIPITMANVNDHSNKNSKYAFWNYHVLEEMRPNLHCIAFNSLFSPHC